MWPGYLNICINIKSLLLLYIIVISKKHDLILLSNSIYLSLLYYLWCFFGFFLLKNNCRFISVFGTTRSSGIKEANCVKPEPWWCIKHVQIPFTQSSQLVHEMELNLSRWSVTILNWFSFKEFWRIRSFVVNTNVRIWESKKKKKKKKSFNRISSNVFFWCAKTDIGMYKKKLIDFEWLFDLGSSCIHSYSRNYKTVKHNIGVIINFFGIK